MKIIDILNKKANEEETPKKFKYDNLIFEENGYGEYEDEDGNNLTKSINYDFSNLNDEIEIIEDTPKEDKKIKKLKDLNTDYYMERKKYGTLTNEEIVLDLQALKNYINEIIDYINNKE